MDSGFGFLGCFFSNNNFFSGLGNEVCFKMWTINLVEMLAGKDNAHKVCSRGRAGILARARDKFRAQGG